MMGIDQIIDPTVLNTHNDQHTKQKKALAEHLIQGGLNLTATEQNCDSIAALAHLGGQSEQEIVSALSRVLRLDTIKQNVLTDYDSIEGIALANHSQPALLLCRKGHYWLLIDDHRALSTACDFILSQAGPIQLSLLPPNQFQHYYHQSPVLLHDNAINDTHLPIPVIANRLITQLKESSASDLHIMPVKNNFVIQARINGLFECIAQTTQEIGQALINYWKVAAKIDITQQQLPQDGVILPDLHSSISLRLSTCPTLYGEKMVLRLHALSAKSFTLDKLGLAYKQIKILQSALEQPHGLILFVGPTGSGKTHSLYASLLHLVKKPLHCISIEDPIEINIPGITQVPVSAGLSYANALRTVLRQDPDVVVIGEIRDSETAKIAIAASQTGHLVLATVHADSAQGAIARLHELGIRKESCLSQMTLCVTQRLLRLLRNDSSIKHPCDSRYCGRTGVFDLVLPEMIGETEMQSHDRLFHTIYTLIKTKKTDWREVTRVFGLKKTASMKGEAYADDSSSHS